MLSIGYVCDVVSSFILQKKWRKNSNKTASQGLPAKQSLKQWQWWWHYVGYLTGLAWLD